MKMIKLTEVNSISEAYLIRSVLESNGIKVELKDENALVLQPDIVFGIQGIEILVEETNLAKAKEVINLYSKDNDRKKRK